MPENSIHTVAVHAGERAAIRRFTPVVTPIYHASSYVYDEMETLDATFAGTFDGPMYTRDGNPTVSALAAAVAGWRVARRRWPTARAWQPSTARSLAVAGGTSVVAAQDCYGATYALLSRLLASQGVTPLFVDTADFAAVEAASQPLGPPARRLRANCSRRSPTRCSRWPICPRWPCSRTRPSGLVPIVDNTFVFPPYLCRPLGLGADYVVHSATKYRAATVHRSDPVGT